jgi:Icc-related predicted phosphoesterase
MNCLFVSDLHGRRARYDALFEAIERERPRMVFLGGDLLAGGLRASAGEAALEGHVAPALRGLRDRLGDDYPRIFAIAGNDDPRMHEADFLALDEEGLWTYLHGRLERHEGFHIAGYAFVPPTPFRLKDWERYDVSRYVDPGCVAPEDGLHTATTNASELRYRTIKDDLDDLFPDADPERAIVLFHAPPHNTCLDRAGLDGVMVDHAPVDVHVGSIAIRRFIEARQPLLTLHGHIHEAARLTGSWRERLGRTLCLGAAHDGPGLALVRFNLERLDEAERVLV